MGMRPWSRPRRVARRPSRVCGVTSQREPCSALRRARACAGMRARRVRAAADARCCATRSKRRPHELPSRGRRNAEQGPGKARRPQPSRVCGVRPLPAGASLGRSGRVATRADEVTCGLQRPCPRERDPFAAGPFAGARSLPGTALRDALALPGLRPQPSARREPGNSSRDRVRGPVERGAGTRLPRCDAHPQQAGAPLPPSDAPAEAAA